jgi:hypothetical protein
LCRFFGTSAYDHHIIGVASHRIAAFFHYMFKFIEI